MAGDLISRECVSSRLDFVEERVNTEKLMSLTFSMPADGLDDGMQKSCIEARVGRDKQRYESSGKISNNEKVRLLSGTVPILRGGLILMIKSSNKNEWILPKGGWELDESLETAAQRESFEEAGIIGVLGAQLDSVCFKSKSNQNKLHMFPLYVTSVANEWPEGKTRKRTFMHIDDAILYMKEYRPEYATVLEQVKSRNLLSFPER